VIVRRVGEVPKGDAITEARGGHDRRELGRHPLSILQQQFEGVLLGSWWGVDDRGGGVQNHIDTSCRRWGFPIKR